MSTAFAGVHCASLAEELERVYRMLADASGALKGEAGSLSSTGPCHALEHVERAFALSRFERDLLLLCAGASLESRFAAACSVLHQCKEAAWPTLGLALSTLEEPHWSAISRARPLRYWKLIEVGSGPLLQAPLRIDERLLQFLMDVPAVEERLEAVVRPMEMEAATGSAHEQVRAALAHWRTSRGTPVLLISSASSVRRAFFLEMCRAAGCEPYMLRASSIPAAAAERELLARIWTREYALTGKALFVRADESENVRHLESFFEMVDAPVAVEVQPGSAEEHLEGLRLTLRASSATERRKLWVAELGPAAAAQMNGSLDRIVDQFQLDAQAIRHSVSAALRENDGDVAAKLWTICRQHSRRALDHVAQRLEPRTAWQDLVLPPQQTEMLRQVAIHVRRRATVNEAWGFAGRYERGLGLCVLLSGPTGTGKTMAAETIAGELDLDLYRVDLSCVVSKYIGETEKNLRRIFDAAEESSAILLFDEADAIFGKRSEVHDSHDRYANLEISYLLQRIEAYRGIAILTTNMQHALDSAFTRRIRFIVNFPFPDPAARRRIWEGIYPAQAPRGEIDYEKLAQLNVSGGVIRNIAMHAAYLAADDHDAIQMAHLLTAARTEYSKMNRLLTAAEIRGWA
ncbi:ATP-binding protein [Silvibacterium acidisoli]|uniref:ATP-binding protein n=1 Tax=Acidobacteriaceae bacterium ZG23-2 TaxID=2883246 RepID=UPI00406D19A1